MTIQVVDISALGIVCAADSAITFEGSHRTNQGSWPKLFPIESLRAVIGYYGYANVGNQTMPNWLRRSLLRIQANSLDELAFELGEKLDREWIRPPRNDGTGFHLAGITVLDQVNVPCFYHIWNHNGVDGGYKATGLGFQVTSDFLGRDAAKYVPRDLDRFFEKKWSQVYRNGALRVYSNLACSLYDFTKRVWEKGLIQRPERIEDWAWHYRFQLETVKSMYKYLPTKGPPLIGRKILIYTIDPEGEIQKLPSHRRKVP